MSDEEILAQIAALQAQLSTPINDGKPRHLVEYRRDAFTFYTKCDKIVGSDFIAAEGDEVCPVCSQVTFRKDEPEMPFPNVEGMPVEQKEERYGD